MEFRNSDEAVREKVDWNEAAATGTNPTTRWHFPADWIRSSRGYGNGDPRAIQLAIAFLEADPWYLRSGYHKEVLCAMLTKQALTDDQCATLWRWILERAGGRIPGRLMRAHLPGWPDRLRIRTLRRRWPFSRRTQTVRCVQGE